MSIYRLHLRQEIGTLATSVFVEQSDVNTLLAAC